MAQIGVIATKSVGGAVDRNHAKRMLRIAVDSTFERLVPEAEVILLARKRILDAEVEEVTNALRDQLKKANLLGG